MAKIVTVRQADIVHAFQKKGLNRDKFAGFYDGFILGAQHQAEQEAEDLCRATNFATVPSVVEIQVVA